MVRCRPHPAALALLALLLASAATTHGTYVSYMSELRRSAATVQMSYNPAQIIPGRYASGMVGDGNFISSADMGVRMCRLFIDGAAHGAALGYNGTFMLHVLLHYNAFGGISRVKGTVTVQPLLVVAATDLNASSSTHHPPPPPPVKRLHDVQFDPAIVLTTPDNHTTFHINGTATFPFMPIPVSAIAAPLAASFPTPAETEHEFYLTALGANNSCTFRPVVMPNQLDYRGVELQLNADPKKEAKEAFIVMSPFYGMRPLSSGNVEKFAVLLGRHIQWHRSLGFSKHVVYLRPDDMMVFTIIPSVQHWIKKGYLLMVLWENFPEQPDVPLYDQRVVYNHAMLAFTGLDVYLAMVNLDEYVMSLRDDLATVQDMIRGCNCSALFGPLPLPQRQLSASAASNSKASINAGTRAQQGHEGQPVNLLIRRYHSLASNYFRLTPELDMWAATPLKAQHPLARYGVVNRMRPPAVKAMLRPEFVHTYATHSSTHYAPLAPAPDCLFVLHLKYMFHNRERWHSSKTSLRRAGYLEDPELERALKARATQLGDDWLPNIQHQEDD